MFIVINKLAAVNNEIIKCNDEPDEVKVIKRRNIISLYSWLNNNGIIGTTKKNINKKTCTSTTFLIE